MAAAPVGSATHPERVRLGDLDFQDKLSNPCQIVRTGDLLPLSGRQEWRGDAELVVDLGLTAEMAMRIRDASVSAARDGRT